MGTLLAFDKRLTDSKQPQAKDDTFRSDRCAMGRPIIPIPKKATRIKLISFIKMDSRYVSSQVVARAVDLRYIECHSHFESPLQ